MSNLCSTAEKPSEQQVCSVATVKRATLGRLTVGFAGAVWQAYVMSSLRTKILASAIDFGDRLKSKLFDSPTYYGGRRSRVHLHSTVKPSNALFNAVSGEIYVGEHSFFGHNVSLLTGTHDITEHGESRKSAVPRSGRDIEIGAGVWIASNATILGPVRIGDHAVVCAGAVVTRDVAECQIVGGVPAKIVGSVDPPSVRSATARFEKGR